MGLRINQIASITAIGETLCLIWGIWVVVLHMMGHNDFGTKIYLLYWGRVARGAITFILSQHSRDRGRQRDLYRAKVRRWCDGIRGWQNDLFT